MPQRLGGKPTIQSEYLRFLKSAMGDAFTEKDDGTIGIERISFARLLSCMKWATERLTNNYTAPDTSHELLRWWAQILGVRITSSDTADTLRANLKARYQVAEKNTYAALKSAMQVMLGSAFVDLHVNYGSDLDNPPVPTVSVGSDSDLGNGDWYTSRCHLVIELTPTAAMPVSRLITFADTHIMDLLDRVAPAWATFEYTYNELGFDLDIDTLDETSL